MDAIRTMMASREAQKLWRNKAAVLAMAVISIYLLTSLFVMLGGITRDTCDTIVGSNKLPGFFQQDSPEKRYENATTKFLSKIKRALAAEDVSAALDEVELGHYRAADKSPAELEALVVQLETLAAEINESPNLDLDPSMLPKLAELETIESQLKAPLSLWEQFVHSASICLGTDSQGRSIFFRGIYSVKIAIQIGLVTALFSVALGAFLGAAAGYFGGWVDHLVVWIYTTFSSIPNLVLLVVLAYAFTDLNVEQKLLDLLELCGANVGTVAQAAESADAKGVAGAVVEGVADAAEQVTEVSQPGFLARTVSYWCAGWDLKNSLLPVYIAFGATFWIGTCRVIRGETMKLKEMEYVHAAQTAGFGPLHILLRHIIPNTAHLMLINFSLLLIAAIKSEVILSFLGFGVKNQPSWGIMIRDAGNNGDVVGGFFWEIGFATVLMFVLVLAFNILSDALQDAFDPKHV